MTKCVVCQEDFNKRKYNQLSCSPLCKQALDMARTKVRRLRDRGVKDDGKLPVVNCATCGKPFEQKQVNFVTCGKGECIRLRNIQTNRRWSKKNEELSVVKCVICGDYFKQKQTNFITCAKKACTRQRKLETSKRWLERA